MSTPFRRRGLDMILERLEPAGKRVVDVGCGEGALVRALAERGASVVGVECGAEMLARARAATPAGDETYREGVAQDLPAPDGSADRVVFMNSLHHVPVEHMDRALAEAARALVPGGVALINEPLAEGAFFQLTRLVEDEEEVRAEAQAAIRRACDAGLFSLGEDVVYLNPMRFDDFAAFALRMGLVDETRKERVAANEALLRQRFEDLADRGGGGYLFEAPARLSVLVKPR